MYIYYAIVESRPFEMGRLSKNDSGTRPLFLFLKGFWDLYHTWQEYYIIIFLSIATISLWSYVKITTWNSSWYFKYDNNKKSTLPQPTDVSYWYFLQIWHISIVVTQGNKLHFRNALLLITIYICSPSLSTKDILLNRLFTIKPFLVI